MDEPVDVVLGYSFSNAFSPFNVDVVVVEVSAAVRDARSSKVLPRRSLRTLSDSLVQPDYTRYLNVSRSLQETGYYEDHIPVADISDIQSYDPSGVP